MFDGLLPASTLADSNTGDTLFERASDVFSLLWNDKQSELSNDDLFEDLELSDKEMEDFQFSLCLPKTINESNDPNENDSNRMSLSSIEMEPDTSVTMLELPVSLDQIESRTTIESSIHKTNMDKKLYSSRNQSKNIKPYDRRLKKRERILSLEARLARLEKENKILQAEIDMNKTLQQQTHDSNSSLSPSSSRLSLQQQRVNLMFSYAKILITGGPDELEDCLPNIMTKETLIYTPLFGYHKGYESALQVCRQWFTACPDLTITFDNIIPDKEDMVISEFNAKGTHVGSILGMPASNELINIRGTIRVIFDGLKVAELIWLWNDGFVNNPSIQALVEFLLRHRKPLTNQTSGASTNQNGNSTSPFTTNSSTMNEKELCRIS